MLHDQTINGYLTLIGQKLAKSPHSANWPFSFTAIYDKNINVFALPGGPMFTNTATITAADNEAQADYNGALIMAEAGYNPIEMARFFEKLESKGSEGAMAQFLSDHPTPGNRVNAVKRRSSFCSSEIIGRT